ncbi:hypothetical protein I546_0687 [Mycobacterium kansasii 732]|nr:hypothetical protein I546_0687 [Mycobacterium kansasii 732]
MLPASLGGEFALNVDHPHADSGSSSAHPICELSSVLCAPMIRSLPTNHTTAATTATGRHRNRPMLSGSYASPQQR